MEFEELKKGIKQREVKKIGAKMVEGKWRERGMCQMDEWPFCPLIIPQPLFTLCQCPMPYSCRGHTPRNVIEKTETKLGERTEIRLMQRGGGGEHP
jgi:hypothetical protein